MGEKMKFNLMFLTLTVTAAVAFADPAPITSSSDIGLARSLVLSDTPAGSSQMGVGGGEFAGTVNGYSTLYWCVDDQEEFTFGDSGYGNVTLLSNVAANSSSVKYGNVTNGGTPGWTNTTDTFDSVALPGTATSRRTWPFRRLSGLSPTTAPSRADSPPSVEMIPSTPPISIGSTRLC
jgi:hypothetical protein